MPFFEDLLFFFLSPVHHIEFLNIDSNPFFSQVFFVLHIFIIVVQVILQLFRMKHTQLLLYLLLGLVSAVWLVVLGLLDRPFTGDVVPNRLLILTAGRVFQMEVFLIPIRIHLIIRVAHVLSLLLLILEVDLDVGEGVAVCDLHLGAHQVVLLQLQLGLHLALPIQLVPFLSVALRLILIIVSLLIVFLDGLIFRVYAASLSAFLVGAGVIVAKDLVLVHSLLLDPSFFELSFRLLVDGSREEVLLLVLPEVSGDELLARLVGR